MGSIKVDPPTRPRRLYPAATRVLHTDHRAYRVACADAHERGNRERSAYGVDSADCAAYEHYGPSQHSRDYLDAVSIGHTIGNGYPHSDDYAVGYAAPNVHIYAKRDTCADSDSRQDRHVLP